MYVHSIRQNGCQAKYSLTGTISMTECPIACSRPLSCVLAIETALNIIPIVPGIELFVNGVSL